MGSFFSFSHPCSLFSVWGRGLWGWAGRPVGVWAVGFLCCCGDRGGLPVPAPERRGFSSGIGRWLPLWGWWCLDLGVIECIWGVWVWVPCPFCVSTCGARVCILICVHEGGNVCLCIWVLVRLRLCVRSGLRLHLTHHLSRPPPHHHALPVEDAAGALVVSRAGAGCSGERRPTFGGRLAGPGPTGLAGPRLGGGGPLGLRAQGPVCPGVVDCGGACGLAATAPWGVYTVAVGGHTFGLSSALFWVEAAVCPCGGSPGGPVSWGPPDVWGPDLFHACFMPCGMGLLFPHTHY